MAAVIKIREKLVNLATDKKFSEILAGSAWALTSRFIGAAMGLATSVIIARSYGAGVLGKVAVLNSLLHLVGLIANMGTSTSILRLIPEHIIKYSPTSAYKVYRKALVFVVFVSAIIGMFIVLSSEILAEKIFSKSYLSFYLNLYAVFLVFQSLMSLNTQALRGLRLIKRFAFMQILPSLTNLILLMILTIYFFNSDNPIYAQLASLAATGITGWVLMEYAFRLKMQHTDSLHSISIGKILAISFPMLLTSTMDFVIGQTGIIMLGIFRSETEVGYYAIAVRLVTTAAFVTRAVNTIAAPKFSELFHSRKIEELIYLAKKSTKLIFWATTPILIGLGLSGKYILGYIYGWEFDVAYPALAILIFSQFIGAISGSTSIFLNMTGSENALKNIIILITTINILLGLWLIPLIGYLGAALSAMVSLSLKNIIILIYIKLKYGSTIGYFPLVEIINRKITKENKM